MTKYVFIEQSMSIKADFDMPADPNYLYAEDVEIIQRRIGEFINDVEAVEDDDFDSKHTFF